MNGLIPAEPIPAENRKKITVPCVLTMTKYLFDHYRLCMYSYLNRSLHSGLLQRITGIPFTERVINKQVCKFNNVCYWRIDPLNFWADVSITLHLNTAEGYTDWQGVLSLWFSAENSNVLTGTIEELTSRDEPPERGGMVMLSPYLIPYLTSVKVDEEMENLWEIYVPGVLADIQKRNAQNLAKAMGLSIRHLPLHKHESVDSILFLIDDTVQVAEGGKPPREEHIPARTIVINTNVIKREYSDYPASDPSDAGCFCPNNPVQKTAHPFPPQNRHEYSRLFRFSDGILPLFRITVFLPAPFQTLQLIV